MRSLYKNLPQTSGVYLMKDSQERILYIGKAANLRRRVSSYFACPPKFCSSTQISNKCAAGKAQFRRVNPADPRVQKLASEIKKIDYQTTDTVLEALILESRLIKKHQPFFNIKEKDDKSFLYVEITNENFPRVLLRRGKLLPALNQASEKFGPFTSASAIREALKILRRIFPWSAHLIGGLTSSGSRISNDSQRPCFDYSIGLCPGTCVGAISRPDYLKNIHNLKLFFQGKKRRILRTLEKNMKLAADKLEFEKAEKLRRQIFALKHIQEVSLIYQSEIGNWNLEIGNSAKRIEGYDISNISGDYATGSMVVFANGEPNKNEYRKFKIKTVQKPDDTGMLKEVLRRRFKHSCEDAAFSQSECGVKNHWPLPDFILVDGGKAQVSAAQKVLSEFNLKIPVVGIAKGLKRKNNNFIGAINALNNFDKNILLRVRDEAHRFALSYHKKLRKKSVTVF